MGIAAQWVHGARLCVVPHPDNDYHPLALRHRPLAIVSTLLIAIKFLTIGVLAITPQTAELSTITTDRIVQLTNNERVDAGLSPLTTSSKLTKAAQMKAQDMLENQYFAHISPSGVTPWFWMNRVHYTYQVAGENLAIDFTEAEDVVDAWIASPTHKENMMLPDYTETGVAVATGDFQGSNSTIVVHMFGKPTTASASANISEKSPSPTPAVKATTAPSPTTTPTATPTPSPSLSPTPTFIVPSQGETPPSGTPRAPRIALVGEESMSEKEAALHVEGEPNSTIHFLVNNRAQASAQLNDTGVLDYTIGLIDVADGAITIRAYATNKENLQSELSDVIAIVKEKPAPETNDHAVAFILSPDTDNPQVLVAAAKDISVVSIIKGEEKIALSPEKITIIPMVFEKITVKARATSGTKIGYDTLLIPRFNQDKDLAYIAPPASLSKASRTLTTAIAVVIISLLGIAVFVRIRIQRPALIAHSSAVAALALILLFV